MKIVPDTSVIIDGRISDIIKKEKEEIDIVISEASVLELEHQANMGRETGFDGLRELKSLREKADLSKGRIKIDFKGAPLSPEEIKNAKKGTIDDRIRRLAKEEKAILITSDRIQAMVAEARGLEVEFIGAKEKNIKPRLFKLFDSTTMSLHLKENTPVFAKKGHVGEFKLTKIKEKITRKDMEDYVSELFEYAHTDPESHVELEKRGVTVLQLRDHRIVVARPPFSDGIEITAVKPLIKTSLSDYALSEKLLERLESRAEGVFVSGSPGAGKTTFVQALAEFYLEKGKIVKTMEQPRDLQVPDVVTQYSPLEGSMENTSDILVLVRPDYTIFDEVRKTRDFEVFADMRLAGVGLIGVTHAKTAIAAIQRLIGRVDLGVIPHVVDTVIYIEAGKIEKVYELKMAVKVPHGMREADLARPVIQVTDFESKKPEYELYSYGEEIVVIPIGPKAKKKPEIVEVGFTKKVLTLRSLKYRNESVSLKADGKFLFDARVNGSGNIKIKKNSHFGNLLFEAVRAGRKLEIS